MLKIKLERLTKNMSIQNVPQKYLLMREKLDALIKDRYEYQNEKEVPSELFEEMSILLNLTMSEMNENKDKIPSELYYIKWELIDGLPDEMHPNFANFQN